MNAHQSAARKPEIEGKGYWDDGIDRFKKHPVLNLLLWAIIFVVGCAISYLIMGMGK